MSIAYLAITAAVAIFAVISGIGKIRRDPHQVIGGPRNGGGAVAVLSVSGGVRVCRGVGPGDRASGCLALGAAAAVGLVLYFLGAVASHLRVGDVKGVGPAAFMLTLAAGALVLRMLTWRAG